MQVTIDGLHIHYTDEGKGPDVLLLHGWGSSSAVFAGLRSYLSKRFRTIAPDLPGCGESDLPPRPWNIDDYAAFLLKFMKAAGLQDPVLIGHSHGGRICLKLTGEGLVHPLKMVLFGSAGLIPKKTVRQKWRLLCFKTIKRGLTLPGLRRKTRPLLEKARAHYGSADYNAAPPVMRQTLVQLVNTDLRALLPHIGAPTLLIWGENDTATPLADAKLMERLIPDAGLCVLEGATHYCFLEQPARVRAILDSFL